jgi:predicted methyltransferase
MSDVLSGRVAPLRRIRLRRRTLSTLHLLACLALVNTAAAVRVCAATLPSAIEAALSDPGRPPEQVALDPLRKPAELLAFSGLKPEDRVADFMPGNAYFTRIFSRVVGPHGRVYAFLPVEQLAHCSPDEIAGTQIVARERRYSNVTVLRGAADHFSVSEPLDMVWIAQDYHDLHDQFMQPTDIAQFNAAVFRALKPGGVYMIIDHIAAAGSGLRDTETLHRIDPESIRAEVTAARFVLEAQSDVLRNQSDAHVLPVFDPAIRHRTDQIVLRFRKPSAPPITGH